MRATKLDRPSNVYVCNSPSIVLKAEFSNKSIRRLQITLSVGGVVGVTWNTSSSHWTTEKVNQSVVNFCKWMHSMPEDKFLDRADEDLQMQALTAHRLLKEVFTVAGRKIYERA